MCCCHNNLLKLNLFYASAPHSLAGSIMFLVSCIRVCINNIVNRIAGKVLDKFSPNLVTALMHFGREMNASGFGSKVKVTVK